MNAEDTSLELETTVRKDELHLDAVVEKDQIEKFLLHAGHTALKIDGIITKILRACWNNINIKYS